MTTSKRPFVHAVAFRKVYKADVRVSFSFADPVTCMVCALYEQMLSTTVSVKGNIYRYLEVSSKPHQTKVVYRLLYC